MINKGDVLLKVELINYMPNMVETMARAVSKCYDTEPKESVVKGCIKSKHTSVTEHSYYSFEVSGVSRSFLAQLTRHRHLSPTVESLRYTSKENEFTYVVPPSILNNHKSMIIFLNSMNKAEETYNKLLERGIKKEDARFVLPIATEVKMVVSGNYRAWMDFCRLREDKHSQWEIREFAFEVDKLIHKVTPLTTYQEIFGYTEDVE